MKVEAEVEVDHMVEEILEHETSRNEVPFSYYKHKQTDSNI